MSGRKHESLLGKKGEEMVCKFLENRGHTIIERNWRYGHLEIDIISIDKNGIHFVEVKSRRIPFEAEPQESVTGIKQRRLYKAALGYLKTGKGKNIDDAECHFDIASVIFERETVIIRIFEDAFFPGI